MAVGDRLFLQEVPRIRATVVRIHADEGDLALALLRLLPEERELETAGTAPRGPLVHHDWSTAFLLDLRLEGVAAALVEGRGRGTAVGTASGERYEHE
jgi:hypothetical protein